MSTDPKPHPDDAPLIDRSIGVSLIGAQPSLRVAAAYLCDAADYKHPAPARWQVAATLDADACRWLAGVLGDARLASLPAVPVCERHEFVCRKIGIAGVPPHDGQCGPCAHGGCGKPYSDPCHAQPPAAQRVEAAQCGACGGKAARTVAMCDAWPLCATPSEPKRITGEELAALRAEPHFSDNGDEIERRFAEPAPAAASGVPKRAIVIGHEGPQDIAALYAALDTANAALVASQAEVGRLQRAAIFDETRTRELVANLAAADAENTSLREQLAAAQRRVAECAKQEPVAWMYERGDPSAENNSYHYRLSKGRWMDRGHVGGWRETPLTHPPIAPERDALLEAHESRSGVALIVVERRRQIDKEGWSAEHDAKHGAGEMAVAAVCYANPQPPDKFGVPAGWPWHKSWWKPKDRIRDLVRAGALIAAEIDRLARIDAQGEEKADG